MTDIELEIKEDLMKETTSQLDSRGGHPASSLLFSVVFLMICGLVYPLATTFVGGLLFPEQARGNIVEVNGVAVASRLVAQPFVSDHYFYGRPSAANFDPRAVSGSNLASTNPNLRTRVIASSEEIQKREKISALEIPADMLAASGSGIDPHISAAGAMIQVKRVARARGVSTEEVQRVVEKQTSEPTFGTLGAQRVNFIELNVALDSKWPVQK